MRFFILWSILFLFYPNPGQQNDLVENNGNLVIFIQNTKDQHFINNSLPAIRQLAQELGIGLEERDASAGLPTEITSTPAIIFQNHRGRSLYAGRYTEIATLRNFIRTSRRIPQQGVKNCKNDVLTWQSGRTQLAAPLKITALQGRLPKGFSAETFQAEAEAAIALGMSQFKKQAKLCLQKSDRTFYLDFHPYRNKEGQFFLSAALYAQFSCIESIWSNFDQAAEGNFENYTAVFSAIAQQLEEVIFQHIQSAKNGDALSSMAETVPVKNWEALQLVLPEAPTNTPTTSFANFDLPVSWTFHQAIDDNTPVLQFRFPEPLERYAGEVPALSGNLQLLDNKSLASGRFEVNTASLTMGMADLDAKVLQQYIKVRKFPKASFQFAALSKLPPLTLGQTSTMSVAGIFEMMKIKKNIQVSTQITPIFDEAGQIFLQVEAAFSLNITDDFRIKGPDGPDPARKTLLFNLNFLMRSIT